MVTRYSGTFGSKDDSRFINSSSDKVAAREASRTVTRLFGPRSRFGNHLKTPGQMPLGRFLSRQLGLL